MVGRPALGVFVLIGMLGVSPARAADAPSVSYKDDRLTVRAVDVPLNQVLEELARQTGATIRGEVPTDKVSATFESVPAREGLARLLGDRSFTLVYAVDGRLKTVQLKGGPGSAKPVAIVNAAPPAALNKKAGIDALVRMLQNQRPVPVDGKLAAEAEKSEVDWSFLLHAASGHENPVVRAQAFQAAAREVDSNPSVRGIMLQLMTGMSDAELADLTRSIMGDAALEQTRIALQHTQTPEVRDRLRAALRELRRPAQPPATGG